MKGLSPGRGIRCNFGGVVDCMLLDFNELIGVKGGGAGVDSKVVSILSALSSWQF